MKRKMWTIPMVLLLILQLVIPAFATETSPATGLGASVKSAYYVDGMLYTFLQFPEETDTSALQVSLIANNGKIGEEHTPEKLTDQEKAAKYMLLIDCSTSMPAYQTQILSLAEGLMTSQQVKSVAVASFGEDFNVIAENLTDIQAVQNALQGLSYNEQGTDISGDVIKAMEYLKTQQWEAGELINLILVTDGVPFYAHDAAVEAESENTAAESLKTELGVSPQILLHSVCFDNWEQVTYAAVSSSIGCHCQAGNGDEAKAAGKEIAAFYEGLCELSFPLTEYTDVLSLLMNQEFISVTASDLTAPADDSIVDALPGIIDSETDPENGEPESPESPEDSAVEPSEAPAEPQEDSADEEASAEESELEPVTSDSVKDNASNAEEASDDSKQDEKKSGQTVVIIAGAALVIILAAVLTVLIRRKKKDTDSNGKNGIHLEMEVLAGDVSSKERKFVLSDSMFIGSDSRCNVILPDTASLAARIFLRDGQVMIEPLSESESVIIKGMRIFAPNPLRSGDQIMIAQNCLSFMY